MSMGYAPSMSRDAQVTSEEDLDGQVRAATEHIVRRWDHAPRVGIILGTGLGGIADGVEDAVRLDYSDIPYFPRPTAPGHSGCLSCGTIDGVSCLVMAGRMHVYEGTPLWQIALPVCVMRELGIETLIVSNAAGGMNPNYRVGDLMAIVDHIDLMGTRPLLGEIDPGSQLRRPGLTGPYDGELIDQALAIARREDVVCHRGVYVALSGPNYETRAEYRMFRRIGGDAVGMSSVPEVVTACRLGLRTLGLSIVTNLCLPDALAATNGDHVAAAARQAVNAFQKLLRSLIGECLSGREGADSIVEPTELGVGWKRTQT
jgi:purine-nucleoside phosphorylase